MRSRALTLTLLASCAVCPSALAQDRLAEATTLVQRGDFAAAQAAFERLGGEQPENPEVLAYLGRLALDYRGGPDRAVERLERAVALAPAVSRYHEWLGEAYGAKASASGMFKGLSLARRCRAEFARAVELDPGSLSARLSLLQYDVQAPGIAGGGAAKVRADAEAIARLDPYQGLLAQATIAQSDKHYAQAEELLQKATTLDPKRGDSYNQLAYLLLERKRLDEALAVFRRYLEVVPQEPNAFDSLGDGLRAKGLDDEALANYGKAVELDPFFAPSVLNLAQCHEKKGHRDEAAKWYRRYLELRPEGPAAETARARLAELEKRPTPAS